MPSLPYWVSSYNHEELPFEVWLHNDPPRLAAMLRLDHPPAVDDILAIPRGSFEHSPEVELGEAAVVHSLEQMWAQVQLPIPPLPPRATAQAPAPSQPRSLVHSSSALLANVAVHLRRDRKTPGGEAPAAGGKACLRNPGW